MFLQHALSCHVCHRSLFFIPIKEYYLHGSHVTCDKFAHLTLTSAAYSQLSAFGLIGL